MAALLGVAACHKQPKPQPGPDPDPEEQVNVVIPAAQSKYYMSAAEDLKGKVAEGTSGLVIQLQDSKYFAIGERVLSVSFTADQPLAGEIKDGELKNPQKTVTATWASEDPVHYPAVLHAPEAAEYGIWCLPGTFVGKFTVKTNRYTYEFTQEVTVVSGKTATVTLDFATPDKQPKRKVGVLGDSISTFDGTMCDPDYIPFYPGNDPNVGGVNPSIAVDSKEKTYWWRLIYNYMKNGELDVNNSWSGTRVVHEVKSGRETGKSIGAGFVDRAYNFVDPDIILIHGGTNDRNQSTPVGSYDWDLPVGQLDVSCYRSAYVALIKMLQARYEGVQIILIIGDCLTPDYESSTKAIAEHFGLPYVNFVGDPIDKCKGSHPNAPAFDKMAAKIYETCKNYLP